MKTTVLYTVIALAGALTVVSCGQSSSHKPEDTHQQNTSIANAEEEHQHEESNSMQLSDYTFKNLGIKVDTLPLRTLSGAIKVNGQLRVPPQYQATVTAIVGANVSAIKVMESDQVKKGEILAYLSHPNLTTLQTNYVQAYSQFQYLEKDMNRQKRLYEAEVGSGKSYQKTKAEFLAMKAQTEGLEAKLRQLHLNVQKIRNGYIYQQVPVVSPINGYIEQVNLSIGAYVSPQETMIKIVNTQRMHADFMVFEKDIHALKEGQTVYFTVESMPGKRLEATVFAIGKQFEQNPRAVHIHAKIKGDKTRLIPGMYIHGKINASGQEVHALPDAGIIDEDGKSYIFTAKRNAQNNEKSWEFTMVEIQKGDKSANGWTEIKLLSPLPKGTLVAWNKAYYLIAEKNKSQTAHHH